MSTAELLGAVMLAAAVLYALLGGADFGGGVWDALARGPRQGQQRDLIEDAIGPIWEANHVWLILVIVLLFTCFPAAFAAICIELFVPLVLLLIGIVLRGAAFTFRAYDVRVDAVQARWSRLFAASSVIAPLMLGVVVGTLASGRMRVGTLASGRLGLGAVSEQPASAPWLAPFPLMVGLLTLGLFAFIAAVYLTVEARGALQEDFRRRAIAAGVAVFVLAATTAAISAFEAPLIFAGLTARGWSLALHLATAVAACGSFVALWVRRFRLARLAAAVQVALIVVGWGASQFPYLIVPDMTLAAASGAERTQVIVLWALAGGGLLLFPALYLLFRVFKGESPLSVIDPPRR